MEFSNSNKIIALAGNPNVGKSSVFNILTGLHQHTGNWAGKTVDNTYGFYEYKNDKYMIFDIPGTYSLYSNSKEEEIARDFLCFNNFDAVIVVCDATCMERNLNLVLQISEISDSVIVCINLMDEAHKKGIYIDLKKLSDILGLPVIGMSVKEKNGFNSLKETIYKNKTNDKKIKINYPKPVEDAVKILSDTLSYTKLNRRWISMKFLEKSDIFSEKIKEYEGENLFKDDVLNKAYQLLAENNISREDLSEIIITQNLLTAEKIYSECVFVKNKKYADRDRKIDYYLTNKLTGIPIMLCFLGLIFFITLTGANIPSEILSSFLFKLHDLMIEFCKHYNIPEIVYLPLVTGVYRVVAWVVSVMLPPMAIFFPLFTIMEDLGYLPRIAFNLDGGFRKCSACGKQALTMCMGFGCNAVGVTGCRIINSPRERLLGILTNCFVPCNGKFPSMIAIITMFMTFSFSGIVQSVSGTLILLILILLGIFMTFLISAFLSKTLLKGEASSFILELPPYRTPDFLRIIVRSVFDRTLMVLMRAVCVAAPAGLIIWIMANLKVNDTTLLMYCSNFLDPFGKFIGLDGVIVLSFILGIPANEIVVPIMIMSYMSMGTLTEFNNLSLLKEIFVDNGWTVITAINTLIFYLFHWPCATTIATIFKETKSFKWTVLAVIIPAFVGISLCCIINFILSALWFI